ncbi:GGDEF domain-containing protein [Streptomyces sp. SR27]|uniref:GGDEF domain-containing protein n=1 Tax=Streptomyces sp. SR27 TaxID=3076630 RepID=UPI00295AF68F|nr:GGDEF domain-containing protein [Streptomyces sp. SR27]MDV9188200.1 GGDEF domain-containing protein [Streptomyces sp. SR27]
MNPALRASGRFGPRTFLITAVVPLTGWVVHATALHRRLAASRRDPLTGLLRRDAYTCRARRLLARHGDDTTVIMVDADRFKAINDQFGHAAGDTVLAAFGTRLTAWAGPSAAIGRLGGDEFALALELPAACRVQRLEQLVRILHTPVTLDDGRTVAVAASVGAATPAAVGSRDLSALQRAADAALYDGNPTGRPVLATAAHTTVPSFNGRRLGRPGTAAWGRAA